VGGRAESVGVEKVGAMGRTTACLRFFGDTLDPDEITRLLGKPPSDAERKGDTVGPRKNRVARQGSWRLEVADREPDDLDSQVEELLNGLTDDLSIWRHIAQTCRADLFCGAFLASHNEEFHVSPTTLLRLGERGIRLSLDIYAHVESSQSASLRDA